MIDFLPVLYIWLATVATGLLGVIVARYFVNDENASVAGFSAAVGMAIGNSTTLERSALDWWVGLVGVIAGLATLWWHLFKRKEFRRS